MNPVGILLAAGRSTRMGSSNKLLQPWGSGTVVGTCIAHLREAGLERILAVVGHEADRIEAAVLGTPCVCNDRVDEGMGRSIAVGVRAAGESPGGYLITLGDMPRVDSLHFRALIDASRGTLIAASATEGRIGPPALFPERLRKELLALDGEAGAKEVLVRHATARVDVPLDPALATDVDTLNDLPKK